MYYFVSTPNPHIIEGAVTGGPDANDNYQDVRDNYAMSEAVLYNTAPLVGVLARLSVGASTVRSFITAMSNLTINVNQLGEFHQLYVKVLLGSCFLMPNYNVHVGFERILATSWNILKSHQCFKS